MLLSEIIYGLIVVGCSISIIVSMFFLREEEGEGLMGENAHSFSARNTMAQRPNSVKKIVLIASLICVFVLLLF